MGDRANVQVTANWGEEATNVFLYTHWAGSELPGTLQAALTKGHGRWDDPQYLGRAIFQEMIGDDKGVTGYGISSLVGDGDDRILVVNTDDQTVTISTSSYGASERAERRFSFEEYIALDAPSWYDDEDDD